jgi:hypothetical protein
MGSTYAGIFNQSVAKLIRSSGYIDFGSAAIVGASWVVSGLAFFKDLLRCVELLVSRVKVIASDREKVTGHVVASFGTTALLSQQETVDKNHC